jgi:hypothetical protein
MVVARIVQGRCVCLDGKINGDAPCVSCGHKVGIHFEDHPHLCKECMTMGSAREREDCRGVSFIPLDKKGVW